MDKFYIQKLTNNNIQIGKCSIESVKTVDNVTVYDTEEKFTAALASLLSNEVGVIYSDLPDIIAQE